MQHPFLENHFEIRWSQLLPEHVEADIALALERGQVALDSIAAQNPDTATFESSFLALETAQDLVSQPWKRVGHLDSVCNSQALREAQNRMLPRVTQFFSRIALRADLWQVLRTVGERIQPDELRPAQYRFVQETLADFRESGADLPQEQKDRLEAIEDQLSTITQKFSENTLDATNAYQLIITDATELKGLPDSFIEAAREDALRKGFGSEEAPQYRFTLQAPSFSPVMRFVDSDRIRHELYEAFGNVANGGKWDNTQNIRDILRLRAEKAQILGKAHFPDLVLSRRMVKSGAAALAFVEDLHSKTQSAFATENRALEEYVANQRNHPPQPLAPWDHAYWSEKLRQEQFAFNEEELRPYFPLPNVLSGMFELVEKVFGVRATERSEKPEVWHPDVSFYDLTDSASGEHLGSFYTDWYPRESKRGGAWMNYLRTGDRIPGQPRTPHLGLMAGNLNPPSGGKPALLNHREVETIFHEFGHLLHHLLGEVEIHSLNGVNVAWDFVELPSQLMENWCWERESLDLFARHYATGATIPDHLFSKMAAARNFQSARFQMRQLSFAKMDLDLHLHPQKFLTADPDAAIAEILEGYLVPTSRPPRNTIRQFSHLFSSSTGYAAGYYSYKYAEVLDADAFSRFKAEGILNAQTGHDFRHHILSKGNAHEPADLFHNFMGRHPDPQALLIRLGLQPGEASTQTLC